MPLDREPNVQAFPVKIPALWRQASQGMVLGALMARVSLWMQGQPFSWPNTLPVMGLAAIAVAVVYFFQPTLVGASGLKAMSTWGYRRTVAWPDITQVTFARLYFLQPSLKLIDRNGRAFWIARDTRNLHALHTLAKTHGGEQHPLTLALETPLFRL